MGDREAGDTSQNKLFLKLLVGLLLLSLLGLLYIFGAYTWLPKMGGPFAKTYRDIRKLPENEVGLQQAIARLHASLNSTAKTSLFSSNLAEFIRKKPAFAPVTTEIELFFNLSRQVFFEPNAMVKLGEPPKTWLLKFCRQLRDCERGLVPEKIR